MVSMLAFSVVDRGFISGVMVSMLAFSVVDHGFIGGVMVSMLAFSVVDRGFELQSSQKTIKLVFRASHSALRRKTKDWLARNQDSVRLSEWNEISTCGLLFQ